jgi:hypothetical protein
VLTEETLLYQFPVLLHVLPGVTFGADPVADGANLLLFGCCFLILYLQMFSQLFNWRSGLALIAIAIVTGTIFYSNYLAKKIAADERLKIEQWVEAVKDISNQFIG